mmetsp:Transcript_12266/g.19622  ORF Transcript_12266/g.19622 Transcript_12266/m.19622 type:complete len:289 (+) Transcript_12266:48-914(+)
MEDYRAKAKAKYYAQKAKDTVKNKTSGLLSSRESTFPATVHQERELDKKHQVQSTSLYETKKRSINPGYCCQSSSSSSSSSRISSSGSAVIHGNDSKRLEERQQHHHHQHQEQQEEEFNDKLKSLERQLDLVVDHPSSSSSVSSLPAGRQMPSSSSSSGAPPAAAAVAAQDRLLSWIPDTNAAVREAKRALELRICQLERDVRRFADDKKEVLKEMYSWKAKAEALSTEEQRKHEETRATELSLLMLWKLHVELLQLNSSLVVTQRSGDPAAETTKRKTQPDQSPTAS